MFTYLHNIDNMPAVIRSVKSWFVRHAMENNGIVPKPDQIICYETRIEGDKHELFSIFVVKYDKTDNNKFSVIGNSRTLRFKHLTGEQIDQVHKEVADEPHTDSEMIRFADYDDFFKWSN